jgi:glutamate-1-semialdehyde 2,1-aminomutase
MSALRLARAVTGRDRCILVNGAYHGTSEIALATLGARGRRGVPAAVLDDVVLVEVNDVDGLREAVDANAGLLAAILLDLMPNRAGLVPLTQEFVRTARELATRTGALLVIDEVLSDRAREDHRGRLPRRRDRRHRAGHELLEPTR